MPQRHPLIHTATYSPHVDRSHCCYSSIHLELLPPTAPSLLPTACVYDASKCASNGVANEECSCLISCLLWNEECCLIWPPPSGRKGDGSKWRGAGPRSLPAGSSSGGSETAPPPEAVLRLLPNMAIFLPDLPNMATPPSAASDLHAAASRRGEGLGRVAILGNRAAMLGRIASSAEKSARSC